MYIKEYLTNGKCNYVYGSGRFNIIHTKIIFPKLIYKFIRIPVKIQIEFFCETWKADSKIHTKDQG